MKLSQNWTFEDFAVGQIFQSQARTITETDVVTFASWSWDTNPVHTDAVGQLSGNFDERIAHGLLGASVAMGLASRIGVFEGCSIALLGIEGWRFLGPIRLGDTVRVSVEITAKRRTSDGQRGILKRHFLLVNQHGLTVQEGDIDLMVRA